MRFLAILCLALLPGLGWAQQTSAPAQPAQAAPDPQTLADIKQELAVLYVQLKQLKRELVTTSSPGLQNAGPGFQERIDALEFAVQKLTNKTEELENRIDSVVADGTMQLHDLTFRLCELQKGCDTSKLDLDKVLGGAAPAPGAGASGTQAAAVAAAPPAATGPQPPEEMAVGEQEDFDAALKAYNSQDFKQAVSLFQTFNATYPGGPLAAAAHLYRGLALDGLGQTGDAARAYLDAFSVNPDGEEAPIALFQLGLSLHALGQDDQACVTLSEVGVRFPGDAMVKKAETARTRIGCS